MHPLRSGLHCPPPRGRAWRFRCQPNSSHRDPSFRKRGPADRTDSHRGLRAGRDAAGRRHPGLRAGAGPGCTAGRSQRRCWTDAGLRCRQCRACPDADVWRFRLRPARGACATGARRFSRKDAGLRAGQRRSASSRVRPGRRGTNAGVRRFRNQCTGAGPVRRAEGQDAGLWRGCRRGRPTDADVRRGGCQR
jgi:ribosomal protein L44E